MSSNDHQPLNRECLRAEFAAFRADFRRALRAQFWTLTLWVVALLLAQSVVLHFWK